MTTSSQVTALEAARDRLTRLRARHAELSDRYNRERTSLQQLAPHRALQLAELEKMVAAALAAYLELRIQTDEASLPDLEKTAAEASLKADKVEAEAAAVAKRAAVARDASAVALFELQERTDRIRRARREMADARAKVELMRLPSDDAA